MEYSSLIFQDEIKEPPKQFVAYGGGVYFISTTQDLWIGNLLIFVIVSGVLILVQYLVNRFIKNDLIPNYSFGGIILISFLESNLQFISFRGFSQTFQLVPFGVIYYFNLIICYLFVFVIVIYSFGGAMLYENVYKPLFSEGYF